MLHTRGFPHPDVKRCSWRWKRHGVRKSASQNHRSTVL